MKVAVFHGAGKPIAIEDHPDGALGPGDIRIRIARCGICGSDIAMTSGTPFDYASGRPIGHESAGEVIEAGRDAGAFKVGDRVAVLPIGACGRCRNCRDGRPLFCERGVPLFGGFSERMVLPATSALPLPASLSFADGALVEPMACGRKALRVAGMRRGDRLLVLGAGNMALSIIYWARLQGASRIVAASRSAKRDAIVMAMGADAALRLPEDEPGAIERALGGPPDIVAECIGKPGMLQFAIERARLGGQVLSMGMCSAPDTLIPAFSTFREVSLHFPLAYSRDDLIATIEAFDRGGVRPEDMVSDTIALDTLPAMIETMRGPHDHLKVQVDPHLGCAPG
jgi:(R,R)-butanediol dehydrogenase/meso-butanediol dehydrogenase/diacetyl reductase